MPDVREEQLLFNPLVHCRGCFRHHDGSARVFVNPSLDHFPFWKREKWLRTGPHETGSPSRRPDIVEAEPPSHACQDAVHAIELISWAIRHRRPPRMARVLLNASRVLRGSAGPLPRQSESRPRLARSRSRSARAAHSRKIPASPGAACFQSRGTREVSSTETPKQEPLSSGPRPTLRSRARSGRSRARSRRRDVPSPRSSSRDGRRRTPAPCRPCAAAGDS